MSKAAVETKSKKVVMSGDDFPYEPVPMSHRATWPQLTVVWFGAAMVAQLYQCGVNLGTGMGTISNAFLAIFWGAIYLSAFVALNGIIGYTTGCNAALSGTFAYGSKGVAIPGFHIADIGWFVVMNAIFASILDSIYPQVNIRVFSIIISMLFITNGYVGLKQMIILNKIAFPILVIVGAYGLYRVGTLPGGYAAVFSNIYPQKYTLAAGITMVVGTWISGCSRAADYFRYAKSAKDAIISSFLGFFGGFVLCISCGAIWGAATGTDDVGKTLGVLGMVTLGAIMFFVQTWTTAEHSAYVTSTALPSAVEVVTGKRPARRHIILLVGVVGMAITGLDIQNYYVPFISFLGYLIPVIGSISIIDFFILSKTNFHWSGHKDFYKINVNDEDVQHHKFNPAVIPALILGLILGWKSPWGIGAVNALIGTLVVYVVSTFIFNALGFRAKEIKKNEALAAAREGR